MNGTKTARKVKRWNYEEVEVRDDVKTNLPDDWKLRVFKVRSGDSGETYYCQLMEKSVHLQTRMGFCDCMQGKFLAPLTALGIMDMACKHLTNLLAFLANGDA